MKVEATSDRSGNERSKIVAKSAVIEHQLIEKMINKGSLAMPVLPVQERVDVKNAGPDENGTLSSGYVPHEEDHGNASRGTATGQVKVQAGFDPQIEIEDAIAMVQGLSAFLRTCRPKDGLRAPRPRWGTINVMADA